MTVTRVQAAETKSNAFSATRGMSRVTTAIRITKAASIDGDGASRHASLLGEKGERKGGREGGSNSGEHAPDEGVERESKKREDGQPGDQTCCHHRGGCVEGEFSHRRGSRNRHYVRYFFQDKLIKTKNKKFSLFHKFKPSKRTLRTMILKDNGIFYFLSSNISSNHRVIFRHYIVTIFYHLHITAEEDLITDSI